MAAQIRRADVPYDCYDNGTFDYDPMGMFDYLNDGETAYDTFTYTIEDTMTMETDTATEKSGDRFPKHFYHFASYLIYPRLGEVEMPIKNHKASISSLYRRIKKIKIPCRKHWTL